MHVCNLSLGTTKKDFFGLLHELADLAYFRNVALVTRRQQHARPQLPLGLRLGHLRRRARRRRTQTTSTTTRSRRSSSARPGIDVRVAWPERRLDHGDRQQLRRAPHRRHRRPDPRQAPRLTVFQMKAILRALAANVSREAESEQLRSD